MTQAARVALWVPTVVPDALGESIEVLNIPAGAQAPIATKFGLGTGGVAFASSGAIQAGNATLVAIDPAGLRNELVRLLGIPSADMTAGIIATDTIGTPNRLVKYDGAGELPVQPVIDGGTF